MYYIWGIQSNIDQISWMKSDNTVFVYMTIFIILLLSKIHNS